MKNLKELLEASILDIEGSLEEGDKYAKRMDTFGFKYKLRNIFTTTRNELDCFDTYELQKLTKDMFVNDRIKEIVQTPWVTRQMYYLAIFIDNIARRDLKIGNKNLCSFGSLTKQMESFNNNLKDILSKKDIFISDRKYVYSWGVRPNKFYIHFEGDQTTTKNGNDNTDWIEFEYIFEE